LFTFLKIAFVLVVHQYHPAADVVGVSCVYPYNWFKETPEKIPDDKIRKLNERLSA
jgi:hypothetical protein